MAARYSANSTDRKRTPRKTAPTHADPRTVAGFRAEWKELIFPLVAAKAHGAYIEDVDGNRLIDLVNGFGTTAFGHAPDFVTEAVAAQMARGFPIGPQQDTAGPTARRFARFVGHERVTFCNTGSEAVMAAMRLARAVTGRKRIVAFTNDYHGQFDEVLIKAKARGEPGALPIAPGIPHEARVEHGRAALGRSVGAGLDQVQRQRHRRRRGRTRAKPPPRAAARRFRPRHPPDHRRTAAPPW